jgi:acetylornithine deacetylase
MPPADRLPERCYIKWLMPGASELRRRLAELVAFDTQNPSGDERPLVEQLARELRAVGARTVETFEADGHHAVYARFGDDAPSLLVNAHVDTVPANSGYTSPPHTLVAREGRLHGLGTADTKGAIAAIIQALAEKAAEGRLPRSAGVLFSGDEESGGNTCIRAFLSSSRARGITRAIVCEPTGLAVGARHRGIGVAEATATSVGGHSSRADNVPSPIVTLAHAALALDEWGRRWRELGPPGFRGLCLNIAAIDGGVAFNVIPTSATLRLSLRPAPGADMRALLEEAEEEACRAAAPDDLTWKTGHLSPPFATRDLASFEPLLGDRVRTPVDLAFWTEAALFAEAGIDAVVVGPGHIEQAHAADEYVEEHQLEMAREMFLRIFS